MKNLAIRKINDGVVFAVKVVPGSSRSRVAGLLGDALKVNITAAPEKGKANKELIQLLAKLMGCPKSAVSVVTGKTKAHKEIQIVGITPEQLRDALEVTIDD